MNQIRERPHLLQKGFLEEAAYDRVFRVGDMADKGGVFLDIDEKRRGIASRLARWW